MKILYYDLSAIVILIILIMSLFFRKMVSGRANRILVILIVNSLITTIFDCWAEAYTIWLPANESNQIFRYVLFTVYFLTRNLTTVLYQLFLCAVTDTWHILQRNKWLKMLVIVPYLVICITLFTNPLHYMVFHFRENFVYTRGPLIYVLYVVSFFYMICGVIYLVKYKSLLSKDKLVALLLMYPFNLFAILVQLVRPDYLLEMFMTALTLFLVTIIVQRPEEIINPVIGVRNHMAYNSDMKKAFYTNKAIQIILVKIINYRSMLSLLRYDVCNELIKKIATDLMLSYAEEHMSMDIYYLENGLFALVSDKGDSERLSEVAVRCSNVLKQASQIDQLDIEVDSCICIVRAPEDIDNYESLLSLGNAFHTYFPSGSTINDLRKTKDQRMFQLRSNIDGIISDAIAGNKFQMYYQPIYSAKEKRFLSAEALIRLEDENYGFISPELFISAAERNGMILQIGDFVLDEVCRFLSECGKAGLPLNYIEINLSIKQCMQKDLTEKVLFYLEKYHLKPEQVNLEITETAANTNQDIVEENIKNLSDKGIYFSLDDYGTGYSNISRMILLPFHLIKLDKSLVDKAHEDKVKKMLKHTISMLKEIGMEIVVEGVETKETLKLFTDMGCDFIQGYYFSKPLPKEEFVEFIQNS